MLYLHCAAEDQDNLVTSIDEEKMHLSDLEREIRRLEPGFLYLKRKEFFF